METHNNQTALDRLEELREDIKCADKRGVPPLTNGITQAEIISDAYHHPKYAGHGGVSDIAEYLDVSKAKVSIALKIMREMIPELKEWAKGTDYQIHTLHNLTSMSELAQWEFLKQQELLKANTVTDVLRVMDKQRNTLSQIIKENEE